MLILWREMENEFLWTKSSTICDCAEQKWWLSNVHGDITVSQALSHYLSPSPPHISCVYAFGYIFENRFPFAILLWNTYSTSIAYTYIYHPSLSNQNCIGWKHAYSSKYSEDSPSGWAQSNKPSAWHHRTLLLIWIENYSGGCLMEFWTVFFIYKKIALCPLSAPHLHHHSVHVHNSSKNIYMEIHVVCLYHIPNVRK